jgi:endonuclease/exonuclease/phosphatase family metal-dependent hydrolase
MTNIGAFRYFRRLQGGAILVAAALVATLGPQPVGALEGDSPTVNISPPGEIAVVTINAHQTEANTDDGRLEELALALRSRPVALDDSYYAPDVVITQEMSPGQLDDLRNRLNGLFSEADGVVYETLGTPTASAEFLINSRALAPGETATWSDPCLPDRTYQLGRVTELSTERAFTIAGIHFSPDYGSPGDCRERNVDRLRVELAAQPSPAVVGGDFNKRSMQEFRECDPEETSGDIEWWSGMTAPSTVDGRAYADTVKTYNRSAGQGLFSEWTHERDETSPLCDGTVDYKRRRIDYVFVSEGVDVVEAHADHPGWAQEDDPGATSCDPSNPSCKYSDHRFVWCRLRY